MEAKPFNLNDKIKVKLTTTGREYLRQKNYKLMPDRKGYLVLSLWEFAGVFGNACQLPTISPPVKPDIILFIED